MTIYLNEPATCSRCGFTTSDLPLLAHHSCDVQAQGGTCEDWPCCGHEYGDCNGQLYGSDEAIKAEAEFHAYCDHEAGHYACEDNEGDETCESCGSKEGDWIHKVGRVLCWDCVDALDTDRD